MPHGYIFEDAPMAAAVALVAPDLKDMEVSIAEEKIVG
jgi:hypothetical protein